jgi:hypothetical protein
MAKDYINTIQSFFKELVKQHGYPLHMDSAYCKIYRQKHPTCEGCESEEGCRRFSQLMGLIAKNLINQQQNTKKEDLFNEIKKILE